MQLFVGVYENEMLRLFTSTGNLILSGEEEERSLKEAAQQREQVALQRAEQLAARLRQMGLDPDDF